MRPQQYVYRTAPQTFPPDFPERLEIFRQRAGLSWRELARRLHLDARSVRRWRCGVRPASGHLYALFDLAGEMGLLAHLLPAAGTPPTADQ